MLEAQHVAWPEVHQSGLQCTTLRQLMPSTELGNIALLRQHVPSGVPGSFSALPGAAV